MMESSGVQIPTPEPISLREHPLESIRCFKLQWKYFCIAAELNKLSEERKTALFFLYIGREALTFIHDNLGLSCEEMNDCDKILAALEDRHKPRTNLIHQRFSFHQAVQKDADTIDDFVNMLRRLAEQCGYEDQLEEMIRDQLIAGLKNKEIQNELISKSELSLSEAVRFCKLKELEEKNCIRPQNRRVDAQKITNGANFTTALGPSRRLSVNSVKPEKVENDDNDLIFLSQKNSATPSNQAVKRIKLEPINIADDDDDDGEAHSRTTHVESNQSKEANSTPMKEGSFVVSKEDWNEFPNPPIWKVVSSKLLQKFVPTESNGTTLHKSTAVYW